MTVSSKPHLELSEGKVNDIVSYFINRCDTIVCMFSLSRIIFLYCCFSYTGTWELVNLYVETKNFSYHICYKNIGRKHNKRLWSQEKDRLWTDRTEQYASKEEWKRVEINNKETFRQGFKDCWKIKRKVSQNLNDLQNLLINLTVKASSEKAWLLYRFMSFHIV